MYFLLAFIIFILLVKFIIWTIYVHRTNIKIQNKIGKDVFDWMINDGEKIPPAIPKMKLEINQEGLKRLEELAEGFRIDTNYMYVKFYQLSKSFKNLGTAFTFIRIKQDEL